MGCSARQTWRPPQPALDAIALRDASSDMHPTRRTRIHPKGLQSPLEGGPPHRETGANKGSICRNNMLDSLLKDSPLRARERCTFNQVLGRSAKRRSENVALQ